jgi:hypothetical protein
VKEQRLVVLVLVLLLLLLEAALMQVNGRGSTASKPSVNSVRNVALMIFFALVVALPRAFASSAAAQSLLLGISVQVDLVINHSTSRAAPAMVNSGQWSVAMQQWPVQALQRPA